MKRLRTLSSLALLSLAVAPLGAQEPPPQAEFGATVEVRVVNVDVEVTDRDGVPVNGLEKADFELLVDGKPVEITNFDRAARPVPPSAPEAAEAAEAAAGAGFASPSERPKIFVWIDDLRLNPGSRNRVLRELETLLEDQETLGIDVGIVHYDRGTRVVRLPGDRRTSIRSAIEALTRRSSGGVAGQAARRFTFDSIQDLRVQFGCGQRDLMDEQARQYAENVREEVLDSFQALRDFAASMAGLRGRRALVYVADDLPVEPGLEAYLLVEQLCGQRYGVRDTGDLATRLRDVSDAANAAGISFYTYQAGGLTIPVSAGRATPGLDPGLAMLARGNSESAFQALASETGGKTLLNSNRIAPLVEQVRQDFSTSYSLGFSPAGPPDGKRHSIDVRVRREGVRVRSRTGFTDRGNDERRSDRLLAALRFGGGGANPLAVQIESAPTKPAEKDLVELPIRLLVPAANLVFSPGEGSEAHLEVGVAVSDDRGRTAPVVKRYVRVKRSELSEELTTAVVRVPLDLKLRRGPTNLAVLVRDSVGDSESLLVSALDLR